MRSRLHQSLARLKNRVISRDLQDIYLFDKHFMGDEFVQLHAKRASQRAQAQINFKLHDSANVLELIDQINPLNEQALRFARHRLDAGDKAVIGYDNGLPVFYGWLMFGEIEMTYGVFLPMPKSMAFGYNLFTASTHRRRGLMTGFYDFVGDDLKSRNIHTLYVGISTRNIASIKAHKKNGFGKTGCFYTIKLLGTCFTWARFVHAKRFYVN